MRSIKHSIWIGILLLAACSFAVADRIVLQNGSSYEGKLLSKTSKSIKFRVILPNGASVELDFPADRVKSVTTGGKIPAPPVRPKPTTPKPTVKTPVRPPTPKPATPASTKTTQRSASQITALIQRAGKTMPDWWDSVKLNYPKTLDLAGTNPVKGWQPQRNIGAHFWSIVTPNPSRWKSGIKLLHHVMDVRRNDRLRQAQAMDMVANYYSRYLLDYARSAYWHQQASRAGARPTLHGVVGLAECYYYLGSKRMALSLLSKYGLNRRGSVPGIKLMMDMGRFDTAMTMAGDVARMMPHAGYLAAGNIYRHTRKYDKAIEAYGKVIAARDDKGYAKRSKQRAYAAIEAVRLCKTLNISKVPDGTYTASAVSYRGPLTVRVEVSGGRIKSAAVTKHKDDIFFTSIKATPQVIVTKQSVEGIDAVSGATVTCEAIVNAATKALARSQ